MECVRGGSVGVKVGDGGRVREARFEGDGPVGGTLPPPSPPPPESQRGTGKGDSGDW